MEIRHQPVDGALGEVLIERLGSGEYQSFEFMTAFAKQSGVRQFRQPFLDFRDSGGKISAFVGVDMDGTSSEALLSLQELCDELYVVHAEDLGQTFHSKVYALSSVTTVWSTVGSNNLTESGLWKNFETSATEVLDLTDAGDNARALALAARFTALRDATSGVSMQITSPADVEKLVTNGYVKSELAINAGMQRRKKLAKPGGVRLFASGVAFTKPPKISSPAPAGSSAGAAPVATPASTATTIRGGVGEIMWVESLKMTSAARNQLDLSMTGIEVKGDPAAAGFGTASGRAAGSVTFFGIDPAVKTSSLMVTIEYLGIEYVDNKVDFPVGNGTWRIQLNGIDALDVQLHTRVGTDGFVDKLLAFERIGVDRYSLSIADESELSDVEDASVFSAKSPSSRGRRYGVLAAVP